VGIPDGLTLTGERTYPDIWHENYWFRRHEVVYRWVAATLREVGLTATCIVLDAGAGEGYGAELVRRTTSARVVAVDYDAMTVTHLRRTYPLVPVVRGNLVSLPFGDSCVDAVVSLQTIEHLWDQRGFVAECLRVLRPPGLLVLSTPNRLTFPPGNICHAHELTARELADLLRPFACSRMVGLWHGERIRAWEQENGDLVHAQLAAEVARWPSELSAFVASVTCDDFVLRDADPAGADLDAALDLVAVAQVTDESAGRRTGRPPGRPQRLSAS